MSDVCRCRLQVLDLPQSLAFASGRAHMESISRHSPLGREQFGQLIHAMSYTLDGWRLMPYETLASYYMLGTAVLQVRVRNIQWADAAPRACNVPRRVSDGHPLAALHQPALSPRRTSNGPGPHLRHLNDAPRAADLRTDCH